METLSDTDIKTPRVSSHSDAGGARVRRRRLFLWSLMLSFDSYHLSAAFSSSSSPLPDLTPSISVATRRSQLTGTVLFSGVPGGLVLVQA
ncbi:hypothetical protein F2Q69_00033141 [Brassica cretica]|uniref:Uncharacterized protein n=1 Tax=Brassica cretica TaxID=69181 RepID=A0A8S9SJ33_BRACR|nr:hypothetical protein F2Q69_00033141 [Brassica cretica]